MNRSARPLAAAFLILGLTGCVALPDSGPVVDAEVPDERDTDRASDVDARPPEPDASRMEIVTGFLEAMMAWPIHTSVAKQYLTADAGAEWRPEESMIVYSDYRQPNEAGSTVSVELTDPAQLDESGSWRGAAPEALRTLDFRLTIEDGEYRIIDPVDALVVRTSWFQERFRQVLLYYFDPTAQVLAPEPVYVPIGEQLATNLVNALLAGPPRRLRDVVRTFVPPRLSVELSVPVSEDGMASVDLSGEAPSTEQAELLLAQLAATLRQEPAITSFRVTIGGEQVALPGGATEFDVDAAIRFNPADTVSTGVLYGVRSGRLVAGEVGSLEPVDGPLGRAPHALSSVAVAPDATQVAGVSADGHSAFVAPLRDPDDDPVDAVLSGAASLARPAWDYLGRLWLLDRRPGGAVIHLVGRRGAVEVDIPDVSGADVRQLLVSWDGTRLVALVHGRRGDRVVAARVVFDGQGRIDRVIDRRVIWSARGGARVLDLAWTDPSEVAVLTPPQLGALFSVDTIAADGAEVGVDRLATVVSGRVLGLAGTPIRDSPIFALLRDGVVNIRTGETLASDGTRVGTLEYAG